jgi:FMN phosphatase YigB (HAD superfamily)
LFVDDREKNVATARELGIDTAMFRPEKEFADAKNWISRRAL